MRTTTMAGRVAASTAALLLVTACSTGPETADSVDLEGGDTAEQQDADDPDDATGGDTDEEAQDDAGSADPQTSDAGEQADPSDDDASGGSGEGAGTTGAADRLVDLTEAVPGTWPVGDAGTVTFSIVDGALVLDDVRPADGWDADIDEQDPDEIEVDFRRGNVEWEIEIELADGGTILEIEIDQDIEGADPGSYDLGDAGSFSFDIEDGGLVLTALNIADGWTLVERDEEADDIEFELVDGPRTLDVGVELDDGIVDVEIDDEVTGPITGS